MLRPMRMSRSLAAALLLVVAGCGSAGTRDVTASGPAAGPATSPTDVDVMVSCRGDLAWPVSAMTDRLPNAQSGDLLPALEDFAADGGMDLPPLLRDERVDAGDWFVLARDGHAAAVATGPWTASGPAGGAQVMQLENDNGWKVTSWGDCDRLVPFLADGAQWVEIVGVEGGRDTDRPTLLVDEAACTSGRDPRTHLRKPSIVETADSVTVAWTSDPNPDGVAACPSNPVVPVEVRLSAPLGDRSLLDASVWPAHEVR